MPHTLLLADDSPTIHRVIELTFADEDIAVVAVDDGDKAIASLDRLPPDIVLADIGMPGRSGYEVARHVKETPGLAHIPVLLLTGAFEPVDPAVVASMRCDGVLTKPFEPGAVVRRVKELLDASGPAAVPGSVGEPAGAGVFVPPTPIPAVAPDLAVPAAPVVGPAAAPVVPAVVYEMPTEPSPVTLPVIPDTEAPVERIASRDEGRSSIAAPRTEADVESYFEELDQAFATLVSPEQEPLPALDRFVKESSPPGEPGMAAPPASSLVDAFAALLAAERTADSPQTARLRTLPVPPPMPARSVESVERAARHVLEGLSEETLRRIVEDVVAATAERLIREEIDRIKRNIT